MAENKPKKSKAKEKRKRVKGRDALQKLGRAASLVVISGALLASAPAEGSDYELPFISVRSKPGQNKAEARYEESVRAAEVEADSHHNPGTFAHPRDFEAYYDTLMLDTEAVDYKVAITDCGYCQCASCMCPDCSSCGACSVCSLCDCGSCACASCGGMGSDCACDCACDCRCRCCGRMCG